MRLASALLDLVWPRACAGCGRPAGREARHLCWECLAALPLIQAPFCAQCGDPVDGRADDSYRCAFCVDRRPAFDRARSAARHRAPLQGLLHAFKYGAATHLAPDLSLLLVACLRNEYRHVPFDAIAYVPLHRTKERARSYNQAALLARELARRTGLPVAPGVLHRARDTETQTHLSARARARNVRGAFNVPYPNWVQGRHLLLVDDVMTTGATCNECARVLKEAGAAGVSVLTVARG
jgi:ComF family protein